MYGSSAVTVSGCSSMKVTLPVKVSLVDHTISMSLTDAPTKFGHSSVK